MTATGCTCTAPGLCPRHNCIKHAHYLRLCQTRPDYFALWEAGRGPCLAELPSAELLHAAPPPASPASRPSLLARAWGFVRSLARHAAGGFARVSRQQLEARLAQCQACPHYKPEAEACGLCGCCATGRDVWLNKIAWRHESCPANPPRW